MNKCWVAAGRCRAHLRATLRSTLAGSTWMGLVCGVGDYFSQLQVVEENKDRFMPLREDLLPPTFFLVTCRRLARRTLAALFLATL